MKRAILFALFGVVGASINVPATIINIPDDYPTIQQGIDASTDGDTVLVQPDTYVENINFNGHNIVLGSLFLMTEDTTYIGQTIVDGDYSGSVVTFESGEDRTSAISGFTIQNGSAYNSNGGGIVCMFSNPVISHNIIRDNIAAGIYAGGGGIYCGGSSPIIMNNHIQDNYVWAMFSFGGGVYCHGPNSFIVGNRIISNLSKEGGGIFCRDSVTIANNCIVENYADLGAGINCGDGNLILNNTISGNFSYGQGGGISCLSPTSTVINSIIYENEPDEIFADIESPPEILYSDIQDTLWPGEGNISIDPHFRNPAGGDFHLMSTACGDPHDSPCIDVGHPDIIDSLLDCSWGLGTILSDMGAYGGGDSVQVGIDDYSSLIPKRLALMQNYPNPFNATTIIQYSLPAASDVTIDIYDLLGRRVETLMQGEQPAGYHQAIWDAKDKPSSIYFYRIQAGEFIETKKMLLLK